MGEMQIIADLIWCRENHSALLEKYREKWVAIRDKKVLAGSKSIKELRRKIGSSGEDEYAIYYVDSGSSIYET